MERNELKKYYEKKYPLLSDRINVFRSRGIKGKFFDIVDFMFKFGENPECYLTGACIDFSNKKSFHLEHIVPVSRGGTNTLDNLQISTPMSNFIKGNMTSEEFFIKHKKHTFPINKLINFSNYYFPKMNKKTDGETYVEMIEAKMTWCISKECKRELGILGNFYYFSEEFLIDRQVFIKKWNELILL